MAIIYIIALLKVLCSSILLLSIVHCYTDPHEHFNSHPVLTVFRQFFDERKHASQLGTFGTGYNFTESCQNSKEILKQIGSYNDTVHKIVKTVLHGEFQGSSYKALALFVDLFPRRLPGSDTLDDAITFLEGQMYQAGMTNLREEESQTVKWTR